MKRLFKKGEYSKSVRMFINPEESFIMRSIIDYENSGIQQFRLAMSEIPPGQSTPMHVHNADEIMYVLEGEGVFTVEGEEYEVGPGDSFYVKANLVHGPNTNTGDTVWRFLYVIGQLLEPQTWHNSYLPNGEKPNVEIID
jgi:quercetin dioxygenase-like cupin family protein